METELKSVRWGDVYLYDPGQTRGSVQRGERPVLVIQNDWSAASPVTTVAMITSRCKKPGLCTHVLLDRVRGLDKTSMVELEQVRTVDKREELLQFLGRVEDPETAERIRSGIAYQFGLKRCRRERRGALLHLCAACLRREREGGGSLIRRMDPYSRDQAPCDRCAGGWGYEYFLAPREQGAPADADADHPG